MNSAQEWRSLLDALRAVRAGDAASAALVTLVRTRGSTFRRAGTRMLVFADSRVVCELSGGCPQRDIVLRAMECIADGTTRRVTYNENSSFDVLMEMGCGGELEVLIEPLAGAARTAFVAPLLERLERRRRVWLATWYARDGETHPTRHLILDDDGVVHDGFGDAALVERVAAIVAERRIHRALDFRLPATGAEADLLLEPVTPPHALYVIGSNSAAKEFAPAARLLDWQLTLVDGDPARLEAAELPPGTRAICARPADIRERLPLDPHSSVVVMTHNIELDIAYLKALCGAPVAYVGALASRERSLRMRSEGGYLGDARLHAPAGLDIGSDTPTEIAVSVMAEILMTLNRRSGGPLHARDGTIHD
ncbi:XdhC family protein [Tahibacter caeni]|uniref:XdhC family protein n=1 Tax=Tahibacter caeni TaxID=1453545 RepID=UPI0021498DDB|nr:XdhC/CoxI family protein [Tahibacter caeni]